MSKQTELATVNMTPMELAHELGQSGKVDPAQLPAMMRELLTLDREYRADQAKAAFDREMVACQEAMPVVVMDAKNTQTGSRYAKLETVMLTCKKTWVDHGFAISFSEGEASKDGMVRVEMRVSHAGHSDMFWREAAIDDAGLKGTKNKTDVQGRQSTFSYLQRQLICSVFNIAVSETDVDGNGNAPRLDSKQIDIINDLLDQWDNVGGCDRPRFFQWIEAETVADIPASRFFEAKGKLEEKIREASK